MPMLAHLEIDSPPFDMGRFLDVIQDLQLLDTITLPRFQLKDDVFERLSHLTHLITTKKDTTTAKGSRDPVKYTVFEPKFNEGSYPSLRNITLAGTVDSVIRTMSQRHFPSKLTGLHLDMQCTQPLNRVSALLDFVTSACGSSLQEFVFHDHDHDYLPSRPTSSCISFDILKPLLVCAQLETLEICHNHVLCLSMKQWEVVASSLPSVEYLCLNEGVEIYGYEKPGPRWTCSPPLPAIAPS
jgi:hypothetical protein